MESSCRSTTAGQGRTYEPGSYFELWVSPWGHVRRTCPEITYRGMRKHAETLREKLDTKSSSLARLAGDS